MCFIELYLLGCLLKLSSNNSLVSEEMLQVWLCEHINPVTLLSCNTFSWYYRQWGSVSLQPWVLLWWLLFFWWLGCSAKNLLPVRWKHKRRWTDSDSRTEILTSLCFLFVFLKITPSPGMLTSVLPIKMDHVVLDGSVWMAIAVWWFPQIQKRLMMLR